jgi:hypothetical protein
MAFENIKQMITDKKAARRARIDAKKYGPIGSHGEGYDPGNPYNLGPGEESFTPDPGFNQDIRERPQQSYPGMPEPNFDAGDWDLENPNDYSHIFDKSTLNWQRRRPTESEPGYNYFTQMSPKGYEGWELPPSGPLDMLMRFGQQTKEKLPRMSPGFPFVPEMEEKIY